MQVEVLIVTPNFNFGGAEKVSINIANLLANAGIKTQIVALDASGPLKPLISSRVSVLETKSKRSKDSFIEIARIIKNVKPKIVLSNTVRMNLSVLLGRLIYRPKNITFICREPNDPYKTHSEINFIFKFLFKVAYSSADVLIAQNDQMNSDIVKFYGVNKRKVKTLHNPVVVSFMDIPQQEEDGYIIFVGRLTKQKNIFSLLLSFKIAIDEYGVKQKLYIFGEGELLDKVREFIKINYLDGMVKIMPPVLNVYDYIAQAKCLVLPSLWEGSPNVVFESLSCGTPVIVSPILEQYNNLLKGANGEKGAIVESALTSDNFNVEFANKISFYASRDKVKFEFFNESNEKFVSFFIEKLNEETV